MSLQESVANKFRGKEYFGHPAGLYVLFFTEMWERFSYYGMRALLVLYMTKYLLSDPGRAQSVLGYHALQGGLINVFGPLTVQGMSSQIYGLYTGFVYLTPLLGGWLADRFWGQYKSVYVGGILMAIGHFLMASEKLFFVALFFIIMGNGCFKPNISTQVGSLYPEGDPRRDGAFTIFYMGINLGAFLAPFVCGTLGQEVAWHWGFEAAGVGMILGLFIYYLGSGLVPKDPIKEKEREVQEKRPLTKEEKYAVGALILLCIVNIAFWAIYEEQGNVMQLWADDRTNWTFWGINFPSSFFQSMNPAFIFMFAPILDMFWSRQAKKGKEPASITKMGIGCFLCGLAYIIMICAAYSVPDGQRGSLLWLTATTLVITIGELYLSPIGLSFVTKVAPKPLVSTMMGMWFLSSFIGNYLTGYIGSFYEIMQKDKFFLVLTAIGVGAGMIFIVLKKPLSKVIGNNV